MVLKQVDKNLKRPKNARKSLKDSFSEPTESSEKLCATVGGAAPNLPCIFPFKFNGIEHFSCTWDMAEPDNKPWCSTLVDDFGYHIENQEKWGNCGPECPISPDQRAENKTESRPKNGSKTGR